MDRLLDYYRHTAALAMDTAHPYEREHRPKVPSARTRRPELADPALALDWLNTELPNLLAVARYAAEHGRPEYVLHLSTILHRYLRGRGRYHDAETLHHQALATARATGHLDGELEALAGLGHIYRLQGQYAQAGAHFQQALQIAQATVHGPSELNALTGLGEIHRLQGQYAQAAAHFQQVLDLARAGGDRNYQFEARQGLGRLRHATGDLDAAITQHREALALADELGQPGDQARALNGLAHAHHTLKQREKSREHWQHALKILTSLGIDHTDDEETNVTAIRTHLAHLDQA